MYCHALCNVCHCYVGTFQFAAWKHESVILHFNALRSVVYDNYTIFDYYFLD